MTYQELLNTDEWKARRKSILLRDLNQCQKCQNQRIVDPFKRGLLTIKTKVKGGFTLILHGKELPGNIAYISEDQSGKFQVLDTVFFEIEKEKELVKIIASRESHKTEFDSNLVKVINAHNLIEYVRVQEKENRILAYQIRHRQQPSVSRKENESYKLFQYGKENFSKKNIKDLEWRFVNGLHVHHHYYQVDLLPWEYPDAALITYCWLCHEDLHKNVEVPVLSKMHKQVDVYTPCPRCHAAGEFPQYRHVEMGICFKCHGAKYVELF
ncbi:MAG: hypothetical protein IPO83_06115 [Chitinophagaceae bacterium]|nr:hypothetical protein [Chitinophagaceae bacterium]